MQLSTAAAWLDKEKSEPGSKTTTQQKSASTLLWGVCQSEVKRLLISHWTPRTSVFVFTGSGFSQPSFPGQRLRLFIGFTSDRPRWQRDTLNTLVRMFRPSVSVRAALGRCSVCVEFERRTQVKDKKKKKKVTNIVSGLHAASCFLFPGALMISNVTDQERTERQIRLTVGRSCKSDIRVKSVLKTLRWSFHKCINESEWSSFSKSTSENLTTMHF